MVDMRAVLILLAMLLAATGCDRPRPADATLPVRRGLDLYFGFAYERAIAAFEEAARQAPASSWPHWGIALALGPNLNHPDMQTRMARAHAEATRAVELARAETVRERDLAAALAARYTGERP